MTPILQALASELSQMKAFASGSAFERQVC